MNLLQRPNSLAVLRALEGNEDRTASDIARLADLPLAVVVRQLHSLKRHPYVVNLGGGYWTSTLEGVHAVDLALGRRPRRPEIEEPVSGLAPLPRTQATDAIPLFVQPSGAPLDTTMLVRGRPRPGLQSTSRPPAIREGSLDARALPSVRNGIRHWPDGRTEPI